MKSVLTIISGIFALIALYLVVFNGDKSVAIINTIGSNSIKGIATLQGRG